MAAGVALVGRMVGLGALEGREPLLKKKEPNRKGQGSKNTRQRHFGYPVHGGVGGTGGGGAIYGGGGAEEPKDIWPMDENDGATGAMGGVGAMGAVGGLGV